LGSVVGIIDVEPVVDVVDVVVEEVVVVVVVVVVEDKMGLFIKKVSSGKTKSLKVLFCVSSVSPDKSSCVSEVEEDLVVLSTLSSTSDVNEDNSSAAEVETGISVETFGD